MTENMWDLRFSADSYFYGKQPHILFERYLSTISRSGALLLPGEGEGRNAVYAARLGWQVDAFDSSLKAREKALKLAAEHAVHIHYQILRIEDFQPGFVKYDMIALIFVHLEETLRRKFHQQLLEVLKPGGRIFLVAFSKEQIHLKSGGPPSLELLYSTEDILGDFGVLQTEFIRQERIFLNEGHHYGMADVISYSGILTQKKVC